MPHYRTQPNMSAAITPKYHPKMPTKRTPLRVADDERRASFAPPPPPPLSPSLAVLSFPVSFSRATEAPATTSPRGRSVRAGTSDARGPLPPPGALTCQRHAAVGRHAPAAGCARPGRVPRDVTHADARSRRLPPRAATLPPRRPRAIKIPAQHAAKSHTSTTTQLASWYRVQRTS